MSKLIFILWVASSLNLALAVKGDDLVYKRQLPNNLILIVTKHDANDIPAEQSLPPGFHYVKADHVYDYDFNIISSMKQIKPIKVWTHQFYSYNPNTNGPDANPFLPSDFLILDAIYEDDTLIIVYKEGNKTFGGTTYASIITKTVNQPGWQAMPKKSTQLIYDNDVHGVYITSAVISGKVKDKTLTLSLKNVTSTINYRISNNKWVLVKPVPETPAIPTEPTDSKKVQDDKK